MKLYILKDIRHYAKYLFASLLLILSFISTAQNSPTSEAQLKQEAAKYFEQEDYADAYPLYSQLLSLYPDDPTYNYRVGACMLFTKEDKEKPIDFIELALKQPKVDNIAYYYLGRAYHLNYKFDAAIRAYQHFKQIASSSELKKHPVDHLIDMCNNGKTLLNNMRELDVLSKKELNTSDYFQAYDLSANGGSVLIEPDDFKSKLDKKKGFSSVIYLSADKNEVFYASYGDDDKNGTDIYMVKRLPTGGFSKPTNLGTIINSPEDEDYPFYDEPTHTLYFCSKGHNSMGGFDVFKSEYNASNDTWSSPVNMDFPINTPDDDILFIADTLNQTAYFASTRSSPKGSIDVYRIKIEPHRPEYVQLRGISYTDDGKNVIASKITVHDLKSNQVVGEYNSLQENGSYFMALPNGGKFVFTVETTGHKTQSQPVMLPVEDNMATLKQVVSYNVSTDSLIIKNDFEPSGTDSDYLLALNYIKQKALMEVHIDSSNLAQQNASQNQATTTVAQNSNGNSNPTTTQNTSNSSSQDNTNSAQPNSNNGNSSSNTTGSNNITASTNPSNNSTTSNTNPNANTSTNNSSSTTTSSANNPDSSNNNPANTSTDQLVQSEINDAKNDAQQDQDAAKNMKDDASKATEYGNDKLLQAQQMQQEAQQITDNANSITDPAQKNDSLNKASNLKQQANDLSKKAVEAYELAAQDENQANVKTQQANDALIYSTKLDSALKTSNSKDAIVKLQAQQDSIQKQQQNTPVAATSPGDLIRQQANNTRQDSTEVAQHTNDLKNELPTLDQQSQSYVDQAQKTDNAQEKVALLQQAKDLSDSKKQKEKEIEDNAKLEQQLHNQYVAQMAEAQVADSINKSTVQEGTSPQIANNSDIKQEIANYTPTANNNLTTSTTSSSGQANNSSNTNTASNNANNTQENNTTASTSNPTSNTATNNNQVNTQQNNTSANSTNNPLTSTDNSQNGQQANNVTATTTNPVNNTSSNNNQGTAQQSNNTSTSNPATNIDNSQNSQQGNNTTATNSNVANNTTNNSQTNSQQQNASNSQPANTGINNQANDNNNSAQNTIATTNSSQQTNTNNNTVQATNQQSNKSPDSTNTQNTSNPSQNNNTTASTNTQQPQVSKTSTLYNTTPTAQYSSTTGISTVIPTNTVQYSSPDASTASKNAATLDADANTLTAQATDLRQQARGTTDPQQAKILYKRADSLDNASAQKSLQSTESIQSANTSQYQANQQQLTAWKNKLQYTNSDAVTTANLLLQDANFYYNKSLAEKQKADSTNKPYLKQSYLDNSKQDISTALLKQQAAENIYLSVDKNLPTLTASNNTTTSSLQNSNPNPTTNISTTSENNATTTNSNSTPNNTSTTQAANNTSTQTSQVNTAENTNSNTSASTQNTIIANNSNTPNQNSANTTTLASNNTAQNSQNNPATNTASVQQANKIDSILSASNTNNQAATSTTQNGTTNNSVSPTNNSTQNNNITANNTTENNASNTANQTNNTQQNSVVNNTTENNSTTQNNTTNSTNNSQNNTTNNVASTNTTETNNSTQNSSNTSTENPNNTSTQNNNTGTNVTANNTSENNSNTNSTNTSQTSNTSQSNTSNNTETNSSSENGNSTPNNSTTANANQSNNSSQNSANNNIAANNSSENNNSTSNTTAPSNNSSQTIGNNVTANNTAENTNATQNNSSSTSQGNNSVQNSSTTTQNNSSTQTNSATANDTHTDSTHSAQKIDSILSATSNGATVNNSSSSTAQNNTTANSTTTTSGNNNTQGNNSATNPNSETGSNTNTNSTTNNPATVTLSESDTFEELPVSPYSPTKPIPINPPLPEGLVFKVQIGAFRNTIPQNLFKGIQPISGEKTGTGLTRYTAGVFKEYAGAKDAQDKIHTLGFKDAFVVAFLNGKRIPLAQAVTMQGGNAAELTAVNQNTENNNQQPASNNGNTVAATPVKDIKGVFYSVQIGAFQHPVSAAQLYNLSPIFSYNAPNGYIRYNCGKYSSVTDANTEKQRIILRTPIKDAFVVAYSDGERIGLAQAAQLLSGGSTNNANSTQPVPANNPQIQPRDTVSQNTSPISSQSNTNTPASPPVTTPVSAPIAQLKDTSLQNHGAVTTPVNTPVTPTINNTNSVAYRALSSNNVEPTGNITVSLTIRRGSINGFAKLVDVIPPGFTVTEGEKQGASFKFEDGKVQYVWLSLPSDSIFTVSYKLTALSTTSGQQTITGKFLYIENNEKQETPIASTTLTVGSGGTTPPITLAPVTNVQPSASVPDTTGKKVTFSVQVGAYSGPIPVDMANKLLTISSQGIHAHKEDNGITTYTIGEYSDYTSADLLKQELVKGGFTQCFIVAYYQGKKISLQQAQALINK